MKTSFSRKVFLCGAALALGILGDLKVPAQPAVEAWVQHYDGPGIVLVFGGNPEKMAVDSSGNVIVTGFGKIDGEFNRFYDWLVIKYSGAGVPLWTNRYQDRHLAMAVAADDSGNVFVTGDSSTTNGPVYGTIKYSGVGVPLWTNLGPRGWASAVALDGSGSVFVTGSSYGTNGTNDYDYATIKYSRAGVPLWTNLYNGPWNGDDRPIALAVDGKGDVIVTGCSWDTNANPYYATIKYSSAGVPLWTTLGPGGGANAVALDGSGNVFVAGYPATIKYSSAGIPLWTNYGGASAVAVDGSGDGLVTASGATTIGYSSGGVPLWTNIGRVGSADAVVVDGSGSVFVTGYPATIKYSSAGIPLWTNLYNEDGRFFVSASAMAVDGSNNVFVTASGATTIGYSSGGVPLWTNRYIESSSHGPDFARSVALDNNGDVVVTGSSYGTNEDNYTTIKYWGAGVPLWTNCGPSGEAIAAAVDGSRNVVVTGKLYDTNGFFATIKYSSAGVPLWTNNYTWSRDYDEPVVALAVDGSGNVVVTGTSRATNGYPEYATVKYSGAGVPLWTNRYRGAGFEGDRALAVAVDGSGNVFVTGLSDISGGNYDYATIKYSSAGVPLWTNRYEGREKQVDAASAVAVDNSGNVFVTGYSHNGNDYDYATIKYSSTGAHLWTNRYNGPGNYDDLATALAVDSTGNVFVTGKSATTSLYPYYSDFATIKYSSAGVPLWTNRYNVPGSVEARAVALRADRSGNVVVLGNLEFTNGSPDCATIKYSSSGVPLWTNRYHGGYATGLAGDSSGNVVVTGYSIGSDGSYDYLTIKYSPAGVPSLTIARTTTNTLAVSWPSPSTGFTLQQNTDPATTNWTPIGTPPADDGTSKTVIINPPVGSAFYRLVHP